MSGITIVADGFVPPQVLPGIYIDIASFVILYYDYALSLSAEVERFWTQRRFSWASLFFYLNRYISLFGHVPIIMEQFWDVRTPNSTAICSILASYHEYLAVTVQVIVGVLLIMRIYALYDRSLKVLLLFLACALAVFISGIWSVFSEHSSDGATVHQQPTCIPPLGHSEAIRFAALWTALLALDLLVFGMTWYKAVTWYKVMSLSTSGVRRPLFHILLRDGTVYFGIMAIASLVNIISFFVLGDYGRGLVTTLANIISSTMMSRLMLNLRDPKLDSIISVHLTS